VPEQKLDNCDFRSTLSALFLNSCNEKQENFRVAGIARPF